MHIAHLILVFIFGACVGSFLNVCIYRIPLKKSIVHPPSACPACEKPIRFYDNVPLVSYFVLRGKCRDCGARISVRYFIVELITAVVFMLIYRRWGLSYEFFIQIFFTAILIVISFIDYDFQIIPDILSIGGMIAGLIISFVRPGFRVMDAVYGILSGAGVLFVIAYGYQLITKREGMGGGGHQAPRNDRLIQRVQGCDLFARRRGGGRNPGGNSAHAHQGQRGRHPVRYPVRTFPVFMRHTVPVPRPRGCPYF